MEERQGNFKPDLRIVFMSGYMDEVVARKAQFKPGVNYLHKPFDLKSLASIIRQVLDEDREEESDKGAKPSQLPGPVT